MIWTETEAGKSSVFTATCDAQDWKSLAKCFEEYWLKLVALLEAKCKNGDLHRLYLEIWIDSGRIIAYPNKKGALRSQWPVSIQIICPLILRESEALPDPEANAETFESLALALEAKVWQAVRKASNDKSVRNAIKSLREQHEFTIWRQSADTAESAQQFFLTS